MKKRRIWVGVICVLFVVACSFGAAAFDWDIGDIELEDPFQDDTQDTVYETQLIADNGQARLFYNQGTTEVIFELTSGERFSTAVSPEYAGTDEESADNMRELFSFLTFDSKTAATRSYSSSDEDVSLTFFVEDNGFDVTAQTAEVSFTVQFRLDGTDLVVTIPRNKVADGSVYLANVSLMPFFGASNNTEEGYIFYPDGCGTLHYFRNKPDVVRSAITKQIYGDAMNELDGYIDDRAHNVMQLTMPVFGINRGKYGLFAEVEQGAADTSLTLAPSGYIFNLARVYPVFHYRYSYFQKAVGGGETLIFSDQAVSDDFSVRYTLLTGENASYIGMAKCLRSRVFAAAQKVTAPNLSVDLLMTTEKSLLLWNASRVVTSFDQAQNFVNTLADAGVDGVRLNLLGWQKKGYNNYPAHLPLAPSAGGMNGLKDLTATVAAKNGLVFLQDNFVEGDFEGSGFTIRRDASYNMQKKVLADTLQTKLLMDIGRGFTLFNEDVKKLGGSGISGYSFDLFGSLVYDNMATGRVLRRRGYIEQVQQYLRTSNEAFGSSAVEGGNYYAFADATFLYNVPDRSSGEFNYDEDVPFIQLVLHGYRPYSGRIFGNFSNSVEEAALHWLEYGYVPSFVLGHESPSVLKDTKSEGFFYSRIDDWQQTIIDIYRNFLPAYETIKGLTIAAYEKDGEIVTVTYENGTVLILNYTDEVATIDGVTVNPLSYAFQ